MLEKSPEGNRAYNIARDVARFMTDRLVHVPYVLDPYEPVDAFEQLMLSDFETPKTQLPGDHWDVT